MSDKLVANELLAFLQQKLDVMDEVSAVQICKSSFSDEDIATAKKLLYESLNMVDRMVPRRRDGTAKSLQEVITLLKETDPDDVPTFVARDLNKLPPVTFDHVDVTSLLKDITTLKASLAKVCLRLDASENTVSDLRKEVADLRESLAVCRSSAAATPSRVSGIVESPASICESSFLTPPPLPAKRGAARAPAPPAPPAPAPPPPASLRVSAAAKPEVTTPPRRDFASVVAQSTGTRVLRPVTRRENKAEGFVENGFTEVKSKKRRRQRVTQNRCGTAPTGPNFLLQAATPTTPVYLSRLHHTTTAQDVTEYIRTKANLLLRVVPLESRHNASFKAFVARVPTARLDTFFKEEFWPKGVMFRRFRGKIRTITTGPTLSSK